MLAFQDTLDVLTKVHAFYNDAWAQLITVLGIGLGVVGVIMPVILTYKGIAAERDMKDRQDKQDAKVEDLIKRLNAQSTEFAGLNQKLLEQEASANEIINRLLKFEERASSKFYQLAKMKIDERMDEFREQGDWKAVFALCEARMQWLQEIIDEQHLSRELNDVHRILEDVQKNDPDAFRFLDRITWNFKKRIENIYNGKADVPIIQSKCDDILQILDDD